MPAHRVLVVMPSPFPGMDPYLEDPGLWPDFHHRLITISSDFLADQLRPNYYVRIEERVYITDDSDAARRVIIPDLQITEFPRQETRPFLLPDGGSVEVAEPLIIDTMRELEIHEGRLEIIDRTRRNVVTVIEVLSPANKTPGSVGEKSYQDKRTEVLNTPSHFVEIDLLREGARTGYGDAMPDLDYLAFISRAELRPRGLLYPILLPQRLPVVGIPLKPEDDSVPLDLQAVLTAAYERAGYDLEIDYRKPPRFPLPPRYAEWANELLKSKGLC